MEWGVEKWGYIGYGEINCTETVKRFLIIELKILNQKEMVYLLNKEEKLLAGDPILSLNLSVMCFQTGVFSLLLQ